MLHIASYTLHLTHCILHFAFYILHLMHCTLHGASYTLHLSLKSLKHKLKIYQNNKRNLSNTDISQLQKTHYKTSWAALVSNSLFGWSLLRLYHILLESVLDVPRKLPLKFHYNRVSNSRDIPDMDKCHLDKCCLDKCHHDCQNLF